MDKCDTIEKFELFDHITDHRSECILFYKPEDRFIPKPVITICTRGNMSIPESYLILYEDTDHEGLKIREKIYAHELHLEQCKDNLFIMHSDKCIFTWSVPVYDYTKARINAGLEKIRFSILCEEECMAEGTVNKETVDSFKANVINSLSCIRDCAAYLYKQAYDFESMQLDGMICMFDDFIEDFKKI